MSDQAAKRGPIRARVKCEDGSIIKIYDDSECKCQEHGWSRRWADLNGIQQLCVTDGLDVASRDPNDCLIAPDRIAEKT